MRPHSHGSRNGSCARLSNALLIGLSICLPFYVRFAPDGVFGRHNRFILIEVGHLAQNICLACEAMKFNSVCLGGVHEEGVGSLLSIDRRAESVQDVILIGTR